MARVPATVLGSLSILVASCFFGDSDIARSQAMDMGGPRLPGACEEPAAPNHGKMGCYFDVSLDLSAPPREIFWHIDEFPNLASADAAKGPASVVVSAYDRTFLYTLNGDVRPPVSGGSHLATIGPLPTPQGALVTARFMQAMTEPGAMTRVHAHGGPEAFFVLSGAICMDSPGGAVTTSAGQTYWIRGNVPMQLHHSGSDVRRSIFVVLHPSSEPWMTMSEWRPTGGCSH